MRRVSHGLSFYCSVDSFIVAFIASMLLSVFSGQAFANDNANVKQRALFSFDHTSIINLETGDRITVDDAISGMMFKFPDGVTTELTYPDDSNLIVSNANHVMFELPHGMSTWYINRIIIRSPSIKNADGVGVGTNVDTFLRTYPFAKLIYTQHDKKLWLSNGVGDTVFELAGKQLINDLKITNDWMTIDTKKLPKSETIKAVIISGRVFDYQSHLGQWQSADKTVYLSLFEQDNQPYYQLIIGERILNQYEGKLITVLDTFYSEPSGNKYHVVLSPGNGDAPDGIPEMTLTLTPHFSLPAKDYVLKKCRENVCR